MVFVLFLSGCGGDGGKRKDSAVSREAGAAPQSPSQVLRTMVEKADALRSARGTVAKTSYASGRVTRMMGSVHYRFKPQLAFTRDFATPATGFDQVEFLVGDTFYMTVPVGHAPAGRWIEYDVGDKNARTAGKVADLLATARQDDPAMNLRMFTASKNMRAVGTEAIWGVHADRPAPDSGDRQVPPAAVPARPRKPYRTVKGRDPAGQNDPLAGWEIGA
ncbi:hypothetical protein [Actinoallomurus rhizosphaericola]|uniref:hypothetical protein n=1 Tax=Actinoallomurus rhizosphaericola TaxID=2952536 RepID=UPI002093CB68|nr:hypothetical protein [Actinoallomurus rhizosphaericola]MCO5997641.1 hypothetical protein [Actinoallomurus rhizosphaericola]